jgi:hypothetical protein
MLQNIVCLISRFRVSNAWNGGSRLNGKNVNKLKLYGWLKK